MVKLGNLLFRSRNFIFPLFYFLLFIPSAPVFSNQRLPVIAGLSISIIGQLIRVGTIGLVYIIRGGKNRQIYAEGLVTEGIFSHCRNPLYVGNIMIIAGLGIMSNSFFFICLMIPLFLFFYQAIVIAEENFLFGKFGEEFTAYKKKVNRWVPNMRGIGKTMSSMEFNWKRVLIREYTTTYIWTSGAVLLFMQKYYFKYGTEQLIERINVFAIALQVMLCVYLYVRFMKKSKRLTA